MGLSLAGRHGHPDSNVAALAACISNKDARPTDLRSRSNEGQALSRSLALRPFTVGECFGYRVSNDLRGLSSGTQELPNHIVITNYIPTPPFDLLIKLQNTIVRGVR